MFTTGFKLYFGIAVGLFIAAIVHGYTTGGGHVGPLTWGWKGGVGDHIGYVVLMGLSVVAGTLALVLVAFRDADPAAQAHYVGVEQLPSTPAVTGSIWPVVGAFGAGTMIVGLAQAAFALHCRRLQEQSITGYTDENGRWHQSQTVTGRQLLWQCMQRLKSNVKMKAF